MPRRSEAEVRPEQDVVLAHIRRGARSLRQASELALIPYPRVSKWRTNDIFNFRERFAEAKGFRDDRAAHERDRKKKKESLSAFRHRFFRNQTPPHQAEWSDAVLRHNRVMILAPPAHGKTTFLEDYVTWRIAMDRNVRVIFVSKSQEVAKKRLLRIQRLLADENWYRMKGTDNLVTEYGPFKPLRDDNLPWARDRLYVQGIDSDERDPTVEALGVGNQIYGSRADLIILDDVATLANMRFPGHRDSVLDWVWQEALTRLDENGKLIAIGTRVNEYDLYEGFMESEAFHEVVQSAILDEDRGRVLWPSQWPMRALLERRKELPPRTWMLLYQNTAIGSPDAAFQLDALEKSKDHTRMVGERPSGLFVSVGVDPAKEGTMAIAVVGFDRHTHHRVILDCRTDSRIRDLEHARTMIVQAVEDYRAQVLVIEQASQQGWFHQDRHLLAAVRSMGCHVRAEHTQMEKFDPDWGVYSLAAMFNAVLTEEEFGDSVSVKRYHVPWLGSASHAAMRPLIDELAAWRPKPGKRERRADRAMALWLAELGLRRMEMMGNGDKSKPRAPAWARKMAMAPPRWLP